MCTNRRPSLFSARGEHWTALIVVSAGENVVILAVLLASSLSLRLFYRGTRRVGHAITAPLEVAVPHNALEIGWIAHCGPSPASCVAFSEAVAIYHSISHCRGRRNVSPHAPLGGRTVRSSDPPSREAAVTPAAMAFRRSREGALEGSGGCVARSKPGSQHVDVLRHARFSLLLLACSFGPEKNSQMSGLLDNF